MPGIYAVMDVKFYYFYTCALALARAGLGLGIRLAGARADFGLRDTHAYRLGV